MLLYAVKSLYTIKGYFFKKHDSADWKTSHVQSMTVEEFA